MSAIYLNRENIDLINRLLAQREDGDKCGKQTTSEMSFGNCEKHADSPWENSQSWLA